MGRATDLHYREMSREFLDRLGLREGSDLRDLQDEKIRIPASLGRGFVDTLMEGRRVSQYNRGRNTWTSAESENAMDAINPVTESADWRVPFRELTPGRSSSATPSRTGSTLGVPKLRLGSKWNNYFDK